MRLPRASRTPRAAALAVAAFGLVPAALAAPGQVAPSPGSHAARASRVVTQVKAVPPAVKPGLLAVDGTGTLYFTDWSSPGTVLRLAQGGVPEALPFTGLQSISSIAVDGAGTVYVADWGASRIVELTSDGVQATLPFTGVERPDYVAVSADGDVYTTSYGDTSVDVMTSDGHQDVVDSTGMPATFHATGIAVDSGGNLLVLDGAGGQLITFTDGGSPVTRAIADPEVGHGSTAVAVDGAGDAYVSNNGRTQVTKLSAGGGESTVPIDGLDRGAGLSVDAAGNVFVADPYHVRILERLADGSQQAIVMPGIGTPTALAVDEAGTLYVGDGALPRVVRVPVSGDAPDIDLGVDRIALALAADTAGHLYVALRDSSGQALGEPDRYEVAMIRVADGSTVSSSTLPDGFVPDSVAVDRTGHVYLSDGSQVLEQASVRAAPRKVTFLGDVAPTDLAVDADGNLYVVDADRARVILRTPSGAQRTLELGSLDGPSQVAVSADGVVDVAASDPGSGLPIIVRFGGHGTDVLPLVDTLNVIDITSAAGAAYLADPDLGVDRLTGPYDPPASTTTTSEAAPTTAMRPTAPEGVVPASAARPVSAAPGFTG